MCRPTSTHTLMHTHVYAYTHVSQWTAKGFKHFSTVTIWWKSKGFVCWEDSDWWMFSEIVTLIPRINIFFFLLITYAIGQSSNLSWPILHTYKNNYGSVTNESYTVSLNIFSLTIVWHFYLLILRCPRAALWEPVWCLCFCTGSLTGSRGGNSAGAGCFSHQLAQSFWSLFPTDSFWNLSCKHSPPSPIARLGELLIICLGSHIIFSSPIRSLGRQLERMIQLK